MIQRTKWKEKLRDLKIELNELVEKDSLFKKRKGKGGNRASGDIKKLLNIIKECEKQPDISDHDVMDILNTIVAITQISTSQHLTNIVQRKADYFWELHFDFMKKRS